MMTPEIASKALHAITNPLVVAACEESYDPTPTEKALLDALEAVVYMSHAVGEELKELKEKLG